MSFANGLLIWGGLLLIAIPVFLHLLMRPRPKSLPFPAIRFVKEVQKTNKRQLQLRHWILLFLRCLVILLIVLALARPSTNSANFGPWITLGGILVSLLLVAWLLVLAIFWAPHFNRVLVSILALLVLLHLIAAGYYGVQVARRDSKHLLGDQQAPVAAVLIVDTSVRMNYRFENKSRLQKAQDTGNWLIDKLPLDSSVAIVPNDTSALFFSEDLRAAKKRLDTLDTNYSSHSIVERISESIDWIEDSDIERKEIYILTDLTVQSWLSNNVSLAEQLKQRGDLSLFVVDVGISDPANFSVGSLELNSSRLSQKSELVVRTELYRSGPAAQRTVKLYLEKPDLRRPYRQDGKTVVPSEYMVRTKSVDFSDDGNASMTFRLNGLPAGVHHGWITIEGEDPLPIDNERFFTIHVRENWKVLLVTPDGVSPNNVAQAITPYAFQETGENLYDCVLIDQRELGRQEFKDFDAIYLLDPVRMNDAYWNDLQNYVAEGGGLVIVAGSNAAVGGEVDDSFVTPAALKVIPAKMTRVFRAPQGGVFFSPQRFVHPMLADFQPLASSVPWNRFPVNRFWGVDLEADTSADSQVILEYGDSTPAILERRTGRGTVVLWTTPVTEPVRPVDRIRWNDLTIGDCWPYLMMIDRLSNYLVESGSETLNYSIGQVASLNNDSEDYPPEYRMFTPRGDEPTRVLTNGDRLTYSFTTLPGPFRLKGQQNGPIVRGFSVNLQNEATDLTRIGEKELNGFFGEDNFQLARENSEIVRQQSAMRIGTEFYPILMLLLAGLFAVELLMSNRFYQ